MATIPDACCARSPLVRAEPVLNAWFDAASQTRTLFEHIDVGIAVDTHDGLLVPVVRQVQKRSPSQLREDLDRLEERGPRAHTIGSEELRNFTFMLSNFWHHGRSRYATPVVVPPTVAILGTGRVRPDAGRRGRQDRDSPANAVIIDVRSPCGHRG